MSYNTCMEVDAEGRLLLLNLPALKQINITKDRLHAVGLRGRRSEFKPTPWTDCSMYNLFLLSKELQAHRPLMRRAGRLSCLKIARPCKISMCQSNPHIDLSDPPEAVELGKSYLPMFREHNMAPKRLVRRS